MIGISFKVGDIKQVRQAFSLPYLFNMSRAELVSASHMLSVQHAAYLSCGVPKQVRDDFGVVFDLITTTFHHQQE